MSCGIAATASRTTATMSGVRTSVWLMTRFSSDSMLQLNSPMRCAPTMRPLPFNVWNARRRSRSASASPGFCSHCGNSTVEPRDVLAGFLDEQLQEFRIGGRECGDGRRRRRGRGAAGAAALPGSCAATVASAADGASSAGRTSRHGITRADSRLDLREARLGGFEHLPLVGPAGLQRLHVVLDGDDGIREFFEPRGRQRALVRPHDAAERTTDAFHDLDGTLLAEHQQARR